MFLETAYKAMNCKTLDEFEKLAQSTTNPVEVMIFRQIALAMRQNNLYRVEWFQNLVAGDMKDSSIYADNTENIIDTVLNWLDKNKDKPNVDRIALDTLAAFFMDQGHNLDPDIRKTFLEVLHVFEKVEIAKMKNIRPDVPIRLNQAYMEAIQNTLLRDHPELMEQIIDQIKPQLPDIFGETPLEVPVAGKVVKAGNQTTGQTRTRCPKRWGGTDIKLVLLWRQLEANTVPAVAPQNPLQLFVRMPKTGMVFIQYAKDVKTCETRNTGDAKSNEYV